MWSHKNTVQIVTSLWRQDAIRQLSTGRVSCVKRQNVEPERMARMMKKIMTGTKHFTRKPDHHSNPSKHLSEFGFLQKGASGSTHRPPSGRLLRRTEMLNNLFIEQITSLLATGEVSPEFLGLGIQISKVKITSDFSAVNVYWYASGTEKDEVIDELLRKTGGHLRHLLSQLRVIGMVPPIQFFKDRTFSKLQEVETLLERCNVPSTTPATTQDPVEEPAKEEFSGDIEFVMTNDILGVNHSRIMEGIMKAVERKSEKKRAQERNQLQVALDRIPEDDTDGHDPTPDGDEIGSLEEEVLNHKKRQYEFLKYLKKQQAERAKLLKRSSVEAKEQEFYTSEREVRRNSQLEGYLQQLDKEDGDDDDYESTDYALEDKYYENLRENFK